MGPLWCGVADEIGDQLQHVGVAADVVEGVITIAVIQVYQVNYPDYIALPQEQRNSGAGQLPFRMSFVKIEKGNTRKNFSGLEIAVLHITLDKPLYLVLQRFPAGLTEMETDDIGGVVHLHGEAAVLLVVGLGGLGRVVAHLHTSIKMGDTPPDAFLCVILNDDSDDK